MKVLTAKQFAEADKKTLEVQEISSEDLMERAATLVFDEIHKRLQGAPVPIKIFCGIGNNGGDGLVIARHLVQHGYNVQVYVVNYTDKRSEDFLNNYEKLKEITNQWPALIKGTTDFPNIEIGDFVIDAIFGIGLNRPIEGWMKDLIKHINASDAFVLSVDMPSGLFADEAAKDLEAIIDAAYTLSFQSSKISFFLPDTLDKIGDLQVLDIGLDREYLSSISTAPFLIGKEEAIKLYIPRKKNSHKNDFGHCLIAGGSYGKIGSVLLSATSALRTGAGLCTFYIPQCGYQIAQNGLPEAMVLTDANEKILTSFPKDFSADVICFGMGTGTADKTLDTLKMCLESSKNPMVVDADGLNLLSKNKKLLKLVPENSVLTPHPGELKRLIGAWGDDFEKLEKAKKFSKKYKVLLVIKGAYTFIIDRNEVYINSSGNPGMATAGSGDVLAGVIAGLISQKYSPIAAAILGVYLHGLSGDIVAKKVGYQGLISGDIAKNMGKAFVELFASEQSQSS